MAQTDVTEQDSRAALTLLAMVATAQVQVVSSNVNVLVSVGLGDRAAADFRLAHLTCVALLKMAGTKTTGEADACPVRLAPEHEIFQSTCKLLTEGLMKVDDVHYSQFAVSAVSLVYSLAEYPDSIMGDVIKKMCKSIRDYHHQQGTMAFIFSSVVTN